jgi:predicted nucleic acid-binding protein
VTPDSSVVIAGFAEWHPNFERAHSVLQDDLALAAHVALEVYSTLTRLPSAHRVPAMVACEYVQGFAPKRLTLPAREHDRMVGRLADSEISGGAVYDALVALTAAHHGLTLLTLDRRAEATYKRLDVNYQFV